MLALIGLLLLSPLMMWHERSQRFRMLPPIEQNLQRASHGAALIVLVLLFVYFIVGLNSARAWFPQFARSPADAWPGLLLVVPLAYGIPRFLAGAYRSWGQRDTLLALRALVKVGVGAVGSGSVSSRSSRRERHQAADENVRLCGLRIPNLHPFPHARSVWPCPDCGASADGTGLLCVVALIRPEPAGGRAERVVGERDHDADQQCQAERVGVEGLARLQGRRGGRGRSVAFSAARFAILTEPDATCPDAVSATPGRSTITSGGTGSHGMPRARSWPRSASAHHADDSAPP